MSLSEPTTLTVSGDLTADTAPALLESIEKACQPRDVHLVLDLAETKSIDSHGLGALVRGLKIAKDAGGTLSVGRSSAEVAQMLSLTGLDQVVPVAR